MAMWTLELRHHHHSQILGSPSKYSQRHREQGCAYNVKEMGGGGHTPMRIQHKTSQNHCKGNKLSLKMLNKKTRTYTKVIAFTGLIHFLLMNSKMPMMAQTKQRLPTRHVIISGGSRGTDTSSSQRSPW